MRKITDINAETGAGGQRGGAGRGGWLALGIIALVIFAAITVLVIYGVTQSADAYMALAVNGAYLGGALTSFMVAATEFGREYFWVPVVAIMLVLGKRDTKVLAIELAVLFVIGIAAGYAMKFAMFRTRPGAALPGITNRVPLDTDSSYPSGHALIVFIGAFFALGAFVRSRKARAVAAVLLVEALLVAYSRVYVGAHYPLDVIAGAALAAAIVFLGTAAIERYLGGAVGRLGGIAERTATAMHIPGVL